MKALELYVNYDQSAAAVIHEIGYPDRMILAKWIGYTILDVNAGKVYLSPVVDCFYGLLASWSIGTSPDAELVNSILDSAISTLNPGEKPIVHSDRGAHYRWPGWLDRIKRVGLKRSMSQKGCSPDNAACEGFFGRIKNEMLYKRS